MPVTILDYVKYKTGDKPEYTGADFAECGVAMLGGCERCNASLACYNAYPSTSGYWLCDYCIGTTGFTTPADFDRYMQTTGSRVFCPDCSSGYITELTQGRYTCESCGAEWTP